jgi:hypothetical protein
MDGLVFSHGREFLRDYRRATLPRRFLEASFLWLSVVTAVLFLVSLGMLFAVVYLF